MKFIKHLPYNSTIDGDKLDCALWESEKNICEFNHEHQPDPSDTNGECDTSGHYYGTSDEREPKFCARHFYQIVVSGDGMSNYGLDK